MPINSEFEIEGTVSKIYEHVDKRDRLMAFINITDDMGHLEAVIFADQYYFPLTVGNRILLRGKLTEREPVVKAIAQDYEILLTGKG